MVGQCLVLKCVIDNERKAMRFELTSNEQQTVVFVLRKDGQTTPCRIDLME